MLYLYPTISIAYLVLPPVVLIWAGVVAWRRQKYHALQVLARAAIVGAVAGGLVASMYRWVGGAQPPFSELLVACYLGWSVLCVVYGVNWVLFRGVGRLFRLDRSPGSTRGGAVAQVIAGVFQACLLLALTLPYLGSLLVVYRPKSPGAGNPQTLVQAGFETVELSASDGIRLQAWWIPPCRNRHTDGRGSVQWGKDTVLLCHGFGADKASDLFLARDLVANGYNILALDLRAHGQSGGNFTGFGGIEGRDVLGAVRWVRRNHPDESHRILGLGEGLGAVALIEAAADPGPDGQAISAIAAYNPYDNLGAVIHQVARQHAVKLGQWAFSEAVIPMASVQLGSDLNRVSPARALRALWPRPILILGDPTSRDPVYGRSFDLYEDAYQPKYGYWRDDLDPNALLHDKQAALTVRIFFDGEQSII
ncbi:MAG TPA: alpha/beta hydrolase [Tepidisphaeraceae bacterium]|nr:alpha/beta hydrolase [Tepidisphaeraceae bacterium]